jgi:hypothetical protein
LLRQGDPPIGSVATLSEYTREHFPRGTRLAGNEVTPPMSTRAARGMRIVMFSGRFVGSSQGRKRFVDSSQGGRGAQAPPREN